MILIYFLGPSNIKQDDISSPPCGMPCEYILCLVTLQGIVPFFAKIKQMTKIFLGTWPTTSAFFSHKWQRVKSIFHFPIAFSISQKAM